MTTRTTKTIPGRGSRYSETNPRERRGACRRPALGGQRGLITGRRRARLVTALEEQRNGEWRYLEFLQVSSLVTVEIFMREIPGRTRARQRSRPVDPGVRGGVGRRAQVVVRDPVQPCTGKRRVGFVGDRGEPDVASFGDQQRRQRLGQARLARLGAGHVGVFVEEPPCAGMTLYQVLRELQIVLAVILGACPLCSQPLTPGRPAAPSHRPNKVLLGPCPHQGRAVFPEASLDCVRGT
jgi:hypothetical protein